MSSYKIKIRTANLRVENRKVKQTTLDSLQSSLQLNSYSYMKHLSIVNKVRKDLGRTFYDQWLEFTCTDKLTQKQLRNFVKKLRNKGFTNNNNNNNTPILIDFVDTTSNDILYRFSLDGTPVEVKKKSRQHTNRSSYYQRIIWKKPQ